MTRIASPSRHSLSRRAFLKGTICAGAAIFCHAPARLLAAPAPDAVTETRLLMGTLVTISVVTPSAMLANDALGRAFERMAALEAIFSRHSKGTPLAHLNAQGNLSDAPRELTNLLDRALRFGSLTSGAFDPTVAPVVDLFRAHQNPKGRMHLDAAALATARELVHAPSVHVSGDIVRLERQGMALTLDGIAKGHIVDSVSLLLQEMGVTNHLINAGGDIRSCGMKAPNTPWTVGIENPAAPRGTGAPVQTLSLSGAIATSGSYEIYYDAARKHHHLIDPASGVSPTRVHSVSVTAPTTIQADALATALSVMIPQDAVCLAQSLPGVECCILGPQNLRLTSAGWGTA